MSPDHTRILRHITAHGPISCLQIMEALDLSRRVVYGFLYKARCYGGGKGWVDNLKELPPIGDPERGVVANGPGQYAITEAGRSELASLPVRMIQGDRP